ncbi:hypothetical protein D3C72_2075800 [compost metagenome]
MRQDIFRYAGAVVTDSQPDVAAAAFAIGKDPHRLVAAVFLGHGVDGILDQIDDHLFQLDAVRHHLRQAFRQIGGDDHLARGQLVLGQVQRAAQRVVDVQRRHFRLLAAGQLAQAADDLAGTIGLTHRGDQRNAQ